MRNPEVANTEISRSRTGRPVELASSDENGLPDLNDADELEAFLAAERQDLDILTNDLRVTRPSSYLSGFLLAVSLILLVASLAIAAAPYAGFPIAVSHAIAIGAGFLGVIFSFASYVVFRRFAADRELSRLIQRVIGKASYLTQVVDQILRELKESHTASDERS
jgi:hypothetical protein